MLPAAVSCRQADRAYHRTTGAPAIDIDKLAPDERLHLIEQLWESLRVRPESVPVTAAQLAELDRRLDELDSGEAEAVSWSEVRRRIQSRQE